MPARLTIPPNSLKAAPVPRAPSEVAPASAKKPRKPAGKKAAPTTMDVNLKVDSPKIREMERAALKRRGFKWAMGLIIFICMGALLKITVREAFLKNPQFSLKQVLVDTTGTVSRERIVRASALTLGMNLLTVNMREIQGRIMTLPAVSKVTMKRDYEGRLKMVVTQRQPVAWIELPMLGMKSYQPELGYFIDAEGVTFPCEVMSEDYAALPVIRHETLAYHEPGTPMTDLSIKSALDLLARLKQREEQHSLPKLRQIEIKKPWAMTASLGAEPAPKPQSQFIFGVDDLDDQMGRLDRIWLEARHRKWNIETLNLLVQKNLPITFREPPNLEGLQDPVTAALSTHAPPAAPAAVR